MQQIEQIYRYLNCLSGDFQIAEELTAETFLRASKQAEEMSRLDILSTARSVIQQTYFHGVPLTWSDDISTSKHTNLDALPQPEYDPELYTESSATLLNQCLQQLQPILREVLFLSVCEQIPTEEISQITGLSLNQTESGIAIAAHELLTLAAKPKQSPFKHKSVAQMLGVLDQLDESAEYGLRAQFVESLAKLLKTQERKAPSLPQKHSPSKAILAKEPSQVTNLNAVKLQLKKIFDQILTLRMLQLTVVTSLLSIAIVATVSLVSVQLVISSLGSGPSLRSPITPSGLNDTNSVQIIDTTNWMDYTNPQLGIALRIPPEYSVTTVPNQRKLEIGPAGASTLVSIDRAQTRSTTSFITNQAPRLAAVAPITVAGEELQLNIITVGGGTPAQVDAAGNVVCVSGGGTNTLFAYKGPFLLAYYEQFFATDCNSQGQLVYSSTPAIDIQVARLILESISVIGSDPAQGWEQINTPNWQLRLPPDWQYLECGSESLLLSKSSSNLICPEAGEANYADIWLQRDSEPDLYQVPAGAEVQDAKDIQVGGFASRQQVNVYSTTPPRSDLVALVFGAQTRITNTNPEYDDIFNILLETISFN